MGQSPTVTRKVASDLGISDEAVRQAAGDMVRDAGEFGMSPAARARISAGVSYEPPRGGKFDGLLGG